MNKHGGVQFPSLEVARESGTADLAGGSHAGIAVRVVEEFWTGDPHSVVLLVLPPLCWWSDSRREERLDKVGRRFSVVVVVIRAAAAVGGWEVDGRRVETRPD
jgi:hypothetical protein